MHRSLSAAAAPEGPIRRHLILAWWPLAPAVLIASAAFGAPVRAVAVVLVVLAYGLVALALAPPAALGTARARTAASVIRARCTRVAAEVRR